MKLLMVDSHEAFAHHLRGELLRSGGLLCDLELASSFAAAATQLGAERFDAILIDPYSLDDTPPSLYGDLEQMAPATPVLILAESNDDALAVDAVRLGAHDFLIKDDLQPAWLMRRVRYAIDRRRGESARAKLAGPHVATRHEAPQLAHAAQGANVTTGQLGCDAATAEWREDLSSSSLPAATSAFAASTWCVLQIEHDAAFATLSGKLLQCDSFHPLQVTHVDQIAAALAECEDSRYHAVLLHLADGPDLDGLTELLRHVGDTPVLVVADHDDAAAAVDAMRQGAEDFLSRTEPDLRYLRRAVQLAVVRRDRMLHAPRAVDQTAWSANPVVPSAAERRRHSRYQLNKPIFATPVLPDGSPAATYSADGFSVDVSEGGLRFEIGNLERLPTTHLLVGIEGLDTVLYFATVEARHVVPKGDGLDVGAQFAKGTRDLIRKENLEPTFNPATARYQTGLPLEVIMKWVDFGVFRPALFDRTFVCPQCRAIPTFRNGCRVCGSVRLHSRPLIHHFACAHVGYVSDFEQNGTVICPKCRTRNLIVGADFEHLNGPYHCLDCDWSDTELDTVGQCMKCELRFPMAQAIEEDLIGYHVNRLDPLAFINAG